jgi:hypothetical protein
MEGSGGYEQQSALQAYSQTFSPLRAADVTFVPRRCSVILWSAIVELLRLNSRYPQIRCCPLLPIEVAYQNEGSDSSPVRYKGSHQRMSKPGPCTPILNPVFHLREGTSLCEDRNVLFPCWFSVSQEPAVSASDAKLAEVIGRPSAAALLLCPRGCCATNGRYEDGTIRRSNRRAQRVVTPDAATGINRQQIDRCFSAACNHHSRSAYLSICMRLSDEC